MQKKVYIIGHRNPDTDSVVAAAAYARLKQAGGFENFVPARAGIVNPQTEYIFKRFNMPLPEYLADLNPKAAYYIDGPPVTANANIPLWEAFELMRERDLRVLPIVDDDGAYQCMLHYQGFARYIINNINPHKKSTFSVSMNHLVSTLRAQAITLFDGETVKKSPIVVAAAYSKHFANHLQTENAENALVIVGDRWDIQRYCIERKVRALILSNALTLIPELAELARKNGVTVLSSPYDTAATSMLIIYSTPAGMMGDTAVPLARCSDTVKKIREPISRAPSRCLPVSDDNNKLAGILFESRLFEEPNIEIIMVDHNEPSQAVEGIEHYRILEVIDHHRLGSFSTKYPITFINKVVGATCTIITNLYREQRIPIEKNTASILLCGILADTLSLNSATTTDTDRETADYLSAITGLDIEQLGKEIQTAANQVNALSADKIVAMDLKEYSEQGITYAVSQVETTDPDNLVARKDEVFAVLDAMRDSKDLLFAGLLVTDVTMLDSLLFVSGKKQFMSAINFPKLDEGIYILKKIVSRKKQLIPLFSELVEKTVEN
jgi:manganese-dependent inorganic pyrophosphatase